MENKKAMTPNSDHPKPTDDVQLEIEKSKTDDGEKRDDIETTTPSA